MLSFCFLLLFALVFFFCLFARPGPQEQPRRVAQVPSKGVPDGRVQEQHGALELVPGQGKDTERVRRAAQVVQVPRSRRPPSLAGELLQDRRRQGQHHGRRCRYVVIPQF